MNLVDALVKFRFYTRSKSQGNWVDVHAMSYLTAAHTRAHLEEIRCDKSRFLASASIVGTGAELYTLPADYVKTLILADSDGTKYEQHGFDTKENYSAFIYYIFGAQIGIVENPATGTTLTHTYYQSPQVWSLVASPAGDSNLSTAAQEWAILEAVCTALIDRGDVNVQAMRDIQMRYQRDMIAAQRTEPTVQSFNKTISTGQRNARRFGQIV
jgi:hypothetical protein